MSSATIDPETETRNRNLRQRIAVPPDKLAASMALVIGVGAVGRQVAKQLVAVGVPEMHICDFDTIEIHNCASQGWRQAHLGLHKVSVLLGELTGEGTDIEDHPVPFSAAVLDEVVKAAEAKGLKTAVFCCVDKIELRKTIFEKVRRKSEVFIDGRMANGVARVITCRSPAVDDWYVMDPAVMFSANEAFKGTCTAQSTIFNANIVAGLMMVAFTKWLRGVEGDSDVLFNLEAMELGVTERK